MLQVVLVDKNDKEIGKMEKIKAHRHGFLHRAFSVFLFNKKGEILLQKRAKGKYHSANLWTNACCSHPLHGYQVKKEAERRLKEEMGIDCQKEKLSLKEVAKFYYRARIGDLIEHEIDYIFFGNFNKEPKINKREASDWKWIKCDFLAKDIKKHPRLYTVWFKMIFEQIYPKIKTFSKPLRSAQRKTSLALKPSKTDRKKHPK
jgi:isopentenyl-diphosphate Delta-isomerase